MVVWSPQTDSDHAGPTNIAAPADLRSAFIVDAGHFRAVNAGKPETVSSADTPAAAPQTGIHIFRKEY